MKILYGLQGTGNGHLSRAIEMVPQLMTLGQVDVLISGTQFDLNVPFPVKYQCKGLGFVFGDHGGVHVGKTIGQTKPLKFINDLRELPVRDYDLVVSDFEPITAWACKLSGTPCIGLSHQASFYSDKTPRYKRRDLSAELILKGYAPTKKWIGFHFESYDSSIMPPIIRQSIYTLNTSDEGHITVYLPSFSAQFLTTFASKFPDYHWQIFVKGLDKVERSGNTTLYPVGHQQWLDSIATCSGAIIGAGFEGPSEFLHLGKSLLVVPMKNQYEQLCNAAALELMGIAVEESLTLEKLEGFGQWLQELPVIKKDYPSNRTLVLNRLLELADELHSYEYSIPSSTI